MAFNVGPSAGVLGRIAASRGINPSRMNRPIQRPVNPNMQPGVPPAMRPQPLPVGNPVVFNPPPTEAGPIDTAPPIERTLPVGPPVMGPPDYTNPYQTQVPDMAMQQNIGQNIRKTGGLRSAYGGSAAGLSGGPFRRQMFY